MATTRTMKDVLYPVAMSFFCIILVNLPALATWISYRDVFYPYIVALYPNQFVFLSLFYPIACLLTWFAWWRAVSFYTKYIEQKGQAYQTFTLRVVSSWKLPLIVGVFMATIDVSTPHGDLYWRTDASESIRKIAKSIEGKGTDKRADSDSPASTRANQHTEWNRVPTETNASVDDACPIPHAESPWTFFRKSPPVSWLPWTVLLEFIELATAAFTGMMLIATLMLTAIVNARVKATGSSVSKHKEAQRIGSLCIAALVLASTWAPLQMANFRLTNCQLETIAVHDLFPVLSVIVGMVTVAILVATLFLENKFAKFLVLAAGSCTFVSTLAGSFVDVRSLYLALAEPWTLATAALFGITLTILLWACLVLLVELSD